MLTVSAVVASAVFVTLNTTATVVSATGGAIVPFKAIAVGVEVADCIAIVYPFGTVGSVKLVASFARCHY